MFQHIFIIISIPWFVNKRIELVAAATPQIRLFQALCLSGVQLTAEHKKAVILIAAAAKDLIPL